MPAVNPSLMHNPVGYNAIWTIIAVLLLLLIGAIYFLIFFFTRKKEIKTIAHLSVAEPIVLDLNAIRAKYLAMVDEVVAKFDAKKIKASEAHQELSLVVRRFYAEAYKFKAEFLTLSDLKKTDKKPLTDAIEKYYPDEFDLLEKGPVAESAEIARRLINLEEVKNA